MAMTYTSLTAPKGTAGSIMNWINYSKLDIGTTVDEAQALIYSGLRTREMMTDVVFTMLANSSYFPLPARFLDPIGRMYMPNFNLSIRHKDADFIKVNRQFNATSGFLGANPYTTTNGSNTVSVFLTQHGFTQGSVFFSQGATAFNGATINGTFIVNGVTDANDFTIDITPLGTTPTGSGSGGGSNVTYNCDALVGAFPAWWGIWNENFYFDAAFLQQTDCHLQYYQSLPLLSSSNQSNFLTNRYPQLMRTACMAAAADFMKDDNEYAKLSQRLGAMVATISAENDMQYRGMELDTEVP